MDALIAGIVTKISEANGALEYKAIYDSLSDSEKRLLRSALKQGKAEKKFYADISLVDGEIKHVYKLGERPQS